MKAVEREYAAMRQAADQLLARARLDPTILKGDLRTRDAQHASDRLEGTYVVRVFAEFETGLRLFWGTARTTNPRSAHLIDGLASMRGIEDYVRLNVHRVRVFRNSLVHERGDAVGPIAIRNVRSYVCTFFDRLPVSW